MKTKQFLWTAALSLLAGYVMAEYAGITVHETAGIDRALWPIQVGVTVPAGTSPEGLVLARVDPEGFLHEVAFQLIREIDSHGVDERRGRIRNMQSFDIAFLTALPARAELDFRLYYERPGDALLPVPEMPSLAVERSEGLGRVVDTGAARFSFHPDACQLMKYELAGVGYAPEFYRGERNEPIHGSGDLRTSRNNVRQWNHADEDHGLAYEETSGPVTWQMVRRGYMPHAGKQIRVDVTYLAFAGMPFILTSSHIPFASDWAIEALRKNQLVFSRGHHTHGVFMTHDGAIHTSRAYDPDAPETYFGDLGVHPLPADIPFIGMLHATRGHGIGFVTLNRANLRTRQTLSLQDGGAYYHFLDSRLHGVGNPRNFFYLVRYEAYHGDHRLVVPAGSVFASTSAILAYPVGPPDDGDRHAALEHWIKMLRHPPRVYAK